MRNTMSQKRPQLDKTHKTRPSKMIRKQDKKLVLHCGTVNFFHFTRRLSEVKPFHWRDSAKLFMDCKETRELQYSPSKWSHRLDPDKVIEEHLKTLKEGSDLAKRTIECEIGVPYGSSENEKLDIFGANILSVDAPILIYIHGGYWQLLGREYSSYCAPPLCRAGAVVVVVGYDLAPQVGIDEIVSQIKRAVKFVMQYAVKRGSSGVYLVGHSAGGHLAALMLAQDWMEEYRISNSIIKGAVLVSGVFDLRPIVDTYINEPINMSMKDAIRHSPVFMYNQIIKQCEKRKILVVIGEHDSPEFKRQSVEMNDALCLGEVNSKFIVVEDTDHFNVVEQLSDDNYSLTKDIIQLMGWQILSNPEKTENNKTA